VGCVKESSTDFKMGLGGMMRNVSYQLHQLFTKELKRSSVTVAEWAVLRLIYLSGGTIASSEIAHSTGMTRGAISKLIDKNTKKGLILRTESKTDRRYQDIKLAKKANDLVPKLDKMTNTLNDQYFSCLNATERQTLEHILQKIAEKNQLIEVPVQ
jgi:DNA-binding MarR family transcriptional regulator